MFIGYFFVSLKENKAMKKLTVREFITAIKGETSYKQLGVMLGAKKESTAFNRTLTKNNLKIRDVIKLLKIHGSDLIITYKGEQIKIL